MVCLGGLGAGELVWMGAFGGEFTCGGSGAALGTVDALPTVGADEVGVVGGVEVGVVGVVEGAVLSTGAGELTWTGSLGASF